MKFAVLSDTHYVSREMIPGDKDEASLLRHKVNKAVFQKLAAQTELDTILITGDLVDNGDLVSHREFAEILRSVQAAGKRVFVLTATHDFHFSRAFTIKRSWPVRYRDYPWERPWFDPDKCDYKALVQDASRDLAEADSAPPLMRAATPDDLWEIYHDFGPAQAFSSCDSAYSYAVKLDEKLWCLMLNNNMRDVDALHDFSPAYSPACYRWIEDVMRQAKAEGAFVFACTHHPLVPPVPAYKIGGTTRNMRTSRVGHTLADLGLMLVFSGHTHFADVAFCSSDAGHVLCNVTTPALAFLPPAWRTAEIIPAEHRLITATVPVENDPSFGIDAPTLKEHFAKEFVEQYRKKVEKLPHGLNKIVPRLEVRHLYPLCPRSLTKAQYAEIKNKKMFDLVMELAINMQCGDGQYTPGTAVYRFLMGLSAAADSVIDAQPFVDLRKKLLGYSIREIVEPMLFNNYVPDNEADFVFDRLPAQNVPVPAFSSHAGDILMGLLCALGLLIAPAGKILTAAALPALTLFKKKSLHDKPYAPERY